MKKKLMAIAMTAAMVGSLTACGGGAKETTAAPTEAAKTEAAETEAKAEESKEADAGSGKADGDLITVGYAQVGAESDWRTANTESFKSTFTEENGYKLIFDDAQQKQENQIKAIRSFIQQEVDYIVVAPVVETGWETVLEEAKEAGIPVILSDRQMQLLSLRPLLLPLYQPELLPPSLSQPDCLYKRSWITPLLLLKLRTLIFFSYCFLLIRPNIFVFAYLL